MEILCTSGLLAVFIMLLILGAVVVRQINHSAQDEDNMNGDHNENK